MAKKKYIDTAEFVKRMSGRHEEDMWDVLEETPTADVQEVKRGHWERHYSRPNVFADLYWHCSVCGYKNDDQWAYRYHNFCPNCGAKMERSEG